MAVAHEHEAIHEFDVLIGRLDELQDCRRGDPLLFRTAPRQASGKGQWIDQGEKSQGKG